MAPEVQAAWEELLKVVWRIKDERAESGRFDNLDASEIRTLIEAFAPRFPSPMEVSDIVWEAIQVTKAEPGERLARSTENEAALRALPVQEDGGVDIPVMALSVYAVEMPHPRATRGRARLDEIARLQLSDTLEFRGNVRATLDPAVGRHQAVGYAPAPRTLEEVVRAEKPVLRFAFQFPSRGRYIGATPQPGMPHADVLLPAGRWTVVAVEEHGIADDASVRDLWIVLQEVGEDLESVPAAHESTSTVADTQPSILDRPAWELDPVLARIKELEDAAERKAREGQEAP